MSRLRAVVALTAVLVAGEATAGIAFLPHLSEYSALPRGQYTEVSLIHTRIKDVFDRDGNKIPLGAPFIPPGERTDATLLTVKSLWVGNMFRDTRVPILNERDQLCRIIFTAGHQQATGAVTERGRLFGLTSGGSGLGDTFGLCGIYGNDHRIGPVQFNGLLATTVKAPTGRFDQRALLNIGTNYWSVIPQFAFHANVAGRLFIDGTLAWQFKGSNDRPAFGGLTPTRPADVRNAEVNFAWKFSNRWYADLGLSFRESVGSNEFGEVTINFEDPQPPQELCNTLGIADPICGSANIFLLEPQDRVYRDAGTRATVMTAGLYYVYRASTVLNLRFAQPLSGRGSQLDVHYDVFLGIPDLQNPGALVPGPQISETTATLNGVQEAAAVSASPFLEARLVYLFWAP